MIEWQSTTSIPFGFSASYSSSQSSSSSTDSPQNRTESYTAFSSESISSNELGATTTWSSGSTRSITHGTFQSVYQTATNDIVTAGFEGATITSGIATLEDTGARTYTLLEPTSKYTTQSTIVAPATDSTWTTATTATQLQTTSSESYTLESPLLVIMGGLIEDIVTVANADNTIYLANYLPEAIKEDDDVRAFVPNVFYWNSAGVPLNGWNGTGQTGEWQTQATKSATAAAVAPALYHSSSPASTHSYASSSSGVTWTYTGTSAATITAYTVFFLPNQSSEKAIETLTTQSSSRSTQTAAVNTTYRGISTSTISTFAVTQTMRGFVTDVFFPNFPQWVSDSFASTITRKSFRTMTTSLGLAVETFAKTAAINYGVSGETSAAGGSTTFVENKPELSATLQNLPYWNLYRRPGVWANGQFGASFNLTQTELGYVSVAYVGRNRTDGGAIGMQYSIMPATNNSYTADYSGLTWRPTTSTSASDDTRSTVTTSTAVQVHSALAVAEFVTTRFSLINGNLGPHETAVQVIPRGVYRNQNSQTVWKSGDVVSFDSANTSAAEHLQPQAWFGPDGVSVLSVERNINSIPGFFPRA